MGARVGEERFALRMHDHLRDLGRETANGLSRPHRLWRPQDLKYLESKGFQNILAQTKGRCFHSFIDKSMNCQVTYFLGESDVSADTSTFLLWLKLEYQDFQNQRQLNLVYNKLQPCFPSWIPLQNLRCLIIRNLRLKTMWRSHVQPTIPSTSRIPLQNLGCSIIGKLCFKTLWQSHVQAHAQLRELQIYNTSSKELSDLSAISNSLEKIMIDNCNRLKSILGLSELQKLIELNISNCLELQELSVVHLSCLEKIVLHNCYSLKTMSGISDLRKLEELDISGCPVFEQLHLVGLNNLKRITVDDSFKPTSFELDDCRNLKTISGFLNLEKLVSVNIRDCPKLEFLPSLEGPNYLETVTIDGCVKLNGLLFSGCQNLKRVTGKFDLATLFMWDCPELEALSFLQGVTCLETITVDGCGKLNNLQLLKCQSLKQLCISNCPKLEELPCSALQTCLERISIVGCGKMQNITLPTKLVELVIEDCRELKTVAAVYNHIECLELEELSNVARLSCLKSITNPCEKLPIIQGIDGCGKLSSVQLLKCQNFKQVCISDCPELEELPYFASQTCLEKISIVRCGKMQNIILPTQLVELIIEECRELKTVAVICDHSERLELHELSSVARLSYQKSITSQTCEKLQTIQGVDECGKLTMDGYTKLTIDGCGKLNGLQFFKFKNLKRVCISDCPELEELPCCASQTCIEKISIVRCGKLHNITLPTKLLELRIEECRKLETVTAIFNHSECLELQELSSVARLSCLKRIAIQTCAKLQTIQGIDELHHWKVFTCSIVRSLKSCNAMQVKLALRRLALSDVGGCKR